MVRTEPSLPATQAAEKSRWLEYGLVFILILLAGALRMSRPGLTEFKADEARLLSLAFNMADGQIALRGINSSVGLPNFPASVWLYAAPLLVWPHAYAATLFTGLLSTLSVLGAYWYTRRYWGMLAALAATLLYTVSPWAIIFSRKIWAQNLLPLFVIGWAISATLALVEKRHRFLWLHFLLLAIAVQIHLAAIALILATLILLIIFRRHLGWRDLLIGAVLAALTFIPFALYLGQTGSLQGLLGGTSATSASFSTASIVFATMLSLGTELQSLAGPMVAGDFLALVPDLSAVHWLWAGLVVTGTIILIGRLHQEPGKTKTQAGIVVLIWLVVPPLFFMWHLTDVFLHYFIAILPAPYIVAGVAFSELLALPACIRPESDRAGARLLRGAAWLILSLSSLAQVWVWLTLLGFVTTVATPDAFGVPLQYKVAAVDQAREWLRETNAAEILVAGAGDAPESDAFPAEFEALLRGLPYRFVDISKEALFPAQPSIVILDGRQADSSWSGDLYREAMTSKEHISLRIGEGNFEILLLPGAAHPSVDVLADPPLLLANFVHLLGHDQPQVLDKNMILWSILWRTADNPDPSGYHFFNHLHEGEERTSQADSAAFAPQQWRAGDSVVSRFVLEIPVDVSGPLEMRVGMYRYPSLDNVPLLDEAGNPYVDAATFSLDNWR